MKITFVLPYASLNGGIRVVAIYAERLRRRGHEVLVVSTPRRINYLWETARYLVRGTGYFAERGISQSFFDGTDVEHRVIKRPGPVTDADVPDADVVVATWWEAAGWVAALSSKKGAKTHFVQGLDTTAYKPAELRRVAASMDAVWRLPMRRIVVADWLVPLVQQKSGRDDIAVVPNSVDPCTFKAPPRTKQRVPTLGFMYSTSECKGCDTMIEAMRQVRAALPLAEIQGFGASLPSRRLPLPAEAHYRCAPSQEQIAAIYASCDVWIWGSRVDGFGLPILEAMACRTPVVATRAGAAPELLAQGGGLVVDVDDSSAMAAAALEIVKLDEQAWLRMSEAALRAATSYTWDDATDRLERVLEETASAAVAERSEQVPTHPPGPPK